MYMRVPAPRFGIQPQHSKPAENLAPAIAHIPGQENGHTASSMSQSVHADMSNGEIISDSEAEDEYQGLSAIELMSLNLDLSWSFHMLLLELDEYVFEFNLATANTSALRQGIKGARESLAMLEKLACWIDAGDMMQ
ncbi:hypothetical protein EV421DRAFT_1736072 [Armillaria borealis]|uniref:Uncharacterized protein n=1 Tax=Armillaria borealis TaxID=47425 RepID=A0AA39JIU1_9AGAR|nr:hypothetical protein EV421DRAFT_1736072 [Armillaria borealis]